jgi:DNA-binding SARP family transcriptional activator/streptogramin lyase
VDFNILGPFEVRDSEGTAIQLPGGRERSLLALLLIHRGGVVSSDRIVEALWGERAPETATKAVQGYVSHLRRVLEPGDTGAVLVTRPPGYVLQTNDETVDAVRFERFAADGRRALEDGSPAEAARLLDQALALWRGPALGEFAFEDFARDEIGRLDDLRLSATEDWVESLLRLGRHGELVGKLDALVAANPLRERLRGQAMLALYRSGRQSDALQVYRDGRRLLADELGLEPGPELQRLERAILAQDPALEAPATTTPVARPEPVAEEPPPTRRGHGRRLALVGVVLAAAIAAVLAFAFTRGSAPAPVKIVAPAVVAVDPNTNRVVASIDVGSKPVAIAAGEDAVWVGDARDFTVTRIDPATRRVTKTIGIGAPAVDLAVGAGAVWVATGGFGTVVRIDPELEAPADPIELGDPANPVVPAASSVGVTPGRVWVGAFTGLVSLDPESGRRTGRVDLGRSAALEMAAGYGAVWATTIGNRAKRVEASSAKETTSFYAGTFVAAIARDRSAVWVGAGGSGQVWKIDPVTGAAESTANAGAGTSGIAVGFGAVWVTSWPTRTLYRLDPTTGEVLAAIPMIGTPEDITVGGGLVWVAVQDDAGTR